MSVLNQGAAVKNPSTETKASFSDCERVIECQTTMTFA